MDPQQAISLLGSQPQGVSPTYLRMIAGMMRSPVNAYSGQPGVSPSMTTPGSAPGAAPLRPMSMPGTQLAQNQPMAPSQ